MKRELKLLPNQITLIRILLIPCLWVLALMQLKQFFAIIILFAGLTDFLDGYLARKLHQVTKFGAWFDSFADNLLLFSSFFWFWILLYNFFINQLILIILVLGLSIFSVFLGFFKYKKLIQYHLYLNKFSAILFYVFVIYSLILSPNMTLFYIIVCLAIAANIEEILITFINKRMQRNILSILNSNYFKSK